MFIKQRWVEDFSLPRLCVGPLSQMLKTAAQKAGGKNLGNKLIFTSQAARLRDDLKKTMTEKEKKKKLMSPLVCLKR